MLEIEYTELNKLYLFIKKDISLIAEVVNEKWTLKNFI